MSDAAYAPVFRRARAEDLPALIALLTDDPLGATREGKDAEAMLAYTRAFQQIEADPGQFLAVVEASGEVIGTLQLSVIPGLSRGGALRGQIEAVRIARSHRSRGLGAALFRWAVEECRARGCALVQLTTDRARPDAHRFYEALGFTASHIGYKLAL